MNDKYQSPLGQAIAELVNKLTDTDLQSEHFFEILFHYAFINGHSIEVDYLALDRWLNQDADEENPRHFNPYLIKFVRTLSEQVA